MHVVTGTLEMLMHW